ncbi:PDDEXK nuclease domain-containing protein [Pseudomonas sp. NCHU5208]|uniref:PDDEXK nuclease domain-containing protein n=1 Tax=unclassified Pseudomonas TaxID=196821 RepID=UPI003F94AACB
MTPANADPRLQPLLAELAELIRQARQQAVRAVDTIQVQTCWEVGRHIVEFEQAGQARAAYGKKLLATQAKGLTAEFGKGFDTTNLRHMRAFFLAFPIRDALRRELSWTHYRTLLKLDSDSARQWYMNEAAIQNWSTRALERQIGTLYYERLLASQDRAAVEQEAASKLQALGKSPREFVRDPVLLEFLGLPNAGVMLEGELEQALIDQLQSFLLELGKGFAFVGRQQRISTESKDFYIDLVFYNYLLKCFVIFDLKRGELTHQDIGQMDMYVRMFDDLKWASLKTTCVAITALKTSSKCSFTTRKLRFFACFCLVLAASPTFLEAPKRGPEDGPTVGIILCAQKDASVVRYSVLQGSEQLFASKYKLVLPSEEELRAELDRERARLAEQRGLYWVH